MDSFRKAMDGDDPNGADTPGVEAPPVIGQDERRMHVRAYNFWAKLLHGRAFPDITMLDTDNLGDFGPHSVLLDFASGVDNPAIVHVGATLAGECDLAPDVTHIADVPRRSLLSRLTDHYLQIIANRAPIGFEAEFVNGREETILYRGVLLPFSSDGTTIDHILGVINWKRAAEPALSAALNAEMAAAALATPVRQRQAIPVWADGPVAQEQASQAHGDDAGFDATSASLADWLAEARANADDSVSLRAQSDTTLHDALAHAWGLAHAAEDAPGDFAEMLQDAGIAPSLRAPMTAVIRLVFGADYDKARVADYAAILDYAAREDIAPHLLAAHLAHYPDGVDGLSRTLKTQKRPAPISPTRKKGLGALYAAAPLASVTLSDCPESDAEFVVLVGRREADGSHAIVAAVPEQDSAHSRTLKAAARIITK